MRLLHATDFTFTTVDPRHDHGLVYATVSHRWQRNREITFREFERRIEDASDDLRSKLEDPASFNHTDEPGIAKIAKACQLASGSSITHIWIDTCCINASPDDFREKLDEMNSMFRIYSDAEVCFTFLHDVDDLYEGWMRDEQEKSQRRSFRRSEWFTRGWTLQELLASRNMKFYNSSKEFIGTKQKWVADISAATNIRQMHLEGGFTAACIAEKMSWLSGRMTTYREDMAYCMLGIFDIRLDRRLAEEETAFQRLQQELVKRGDESIFAWTLQFSQPTMQNASYGLLAPWPTCFSYSRGLKITCSEYKQRSQRIETTSDLVKFPIPLNQPNIINGEELNRQKLAKLSSYNLGLNCWQEDGDSKRNVTIKLEKIGGHWRRTNLETLDFDHTLKPSFKSSKLFLLHPEFMMKKKKDRYFPCTLPIDIWHEPDGERDWSRILANQAETDIRRKLDSDDGIVEVNEAGRQVTVC